MQTPDEKTDVLEMSTEELLTIVSAPEDSRREEALMVLISWHEDALTLEQRKAILDELCWELDHTSDLPILYALLRFEWKGEGRDRELSRCVEAIRAEAGSYDPEFFALLAHETIEDVLVVFPVPPVI